LKLAAPLIALGLSGCASTTEYPLTKYGVTVLKNPHTGKSYRCWFRETAITTPQGARVNEAVYAACQSSARAAGYTHVTNVSKFP
jgi:hypothetical protein